MQKIRPDMDIGHNIQTLRKAAGRPNTGTDGCTPAAYGYPNFKKHLCQNRDKQDEHPGK